MARTLAVLRLPRRASGSNVFPLCLSVIVARIGPSDTSSCQPSLFAKVVIGERLGNAERPKPPGAEETTLRVRPGLTERNRRAEESSGVEEDGLVASAEAPGSGIYDETLSVRHRRITPWRRRV